MQTIPNGSNAHHNLEVTVMQCQDVWDLLSAYADGETNAHETEVVEAHIAVCSDCARDLQFMQGTQHALQAIPEVEPPISLRSAILAATVNRPSLTERFATAVRRGLAPAPVRYGALAAAGAAAALTAVTIREGNNPVHYIPKEPTTVATAPHASEDAPAISSGPSVDLLDVYEPQPSVESHPAPRVRVARSKRNDQRPVVKLAKASQPTTARRGAKAASNPSADTRTNQPAILEDLSVASVPGAGEEPTTTPDPEPTTRTLVASSDRNAGDTPNGGAEPTDRGPRIVLTASSVALDPSQVATLADLRRSLSHQQGRNVANPASTRRDRQIRVDVIRGSF